MGAGVADAARTARPRRSAGEQLAPTLDRIAASALAVERMAEVGRRRQPAPAAPPMRPPAARSSSAPRPCPIWRAC